MKIYLSPSNQYDNTYAAGNTNEMEQCNRIAEAAEKHLKRNGFDVKRAPKGQNMTVSINESNAWGADIHIPIHTNAGGGGGTVVFVYSRADKNMQYAQPIYDEVQAVSIGTIDYGVRAYPDLAELNATNALGVYIECEFHDSAAYAQWIIDNADKLGEAICKGVCKGASVTYKPTQSEDKTCTVTLPVLKHYSKGSAVKTLQRLLNAKNAKLSVDGNFGTKTDSAVKAYQKANGLSVDGVVGKKTWTKLLN